MIPAAPMPSPLYAYKITKARPNVADEDFLHRDADGDLLAVRPSRGILNGAYVETEGTDDALAAVYVPHDDAPAVALAILRAAGWEADSLGGPVEHAVRNLAKHVDEAEEAKAAAADAKALDAEALAMLNAAFLSQGMYPVQALPEQIADFWRAAARTARTIHNAN